MTKRDDGETPGLFEPLMVSQTSPRREELNDLALNLVQRSMALQASLPTAIADSLADLVRSMNCYYSNLIEGHHTHPLDIERAINNDYSTDPEKRNLQLEARAHIAVQKWIDEGGIDKPITHPDTIVDLHRRFYQLLPPDLLFVEHPSTGEKIPVIAGAIRDHDVEVGRHIAISPGAVPRFLSRLHKAYTRVSRIDAILAAACAHHRLLWIHPFADGNGRVARLMSYAMLGAALDSKGLWSIARGLARNEMEYKRHLMACDALRQGDLDGRGSLSEAALADFTAFFLQTCIDQVDFMQGLMQANRLRDRILIWVEEEMRAANLPTRSDTVLRFVLLQGNLPRAEVVSLLGVNERSARRVTSALVSCGALTASSTRAPLQLAFPAKLAGRWLPGLFPDPD